MVKRAARRCALAPAYTADVLRAACRARSRPPLLFTRAKRPHRPHRARNIDRHGREYPNSDHYALMTRRRALVHFKRLISSSTLCLLTRLN